LVAKGENCRSLGFARDDKGEGRADRSNLLPMDGQSRRFLSFLAGVWLVGEEFFAYVLEDG
jgi:hypothetical protein